MINGPLSGLIAAGLWGSADFSGGLATKRAAPTFVVTAAHGFGLALLIAAAFFLHPLPGSYTLDGLLSGVFCGAGLVALYAALSRGSMGLASALSGVLTAVVPIAWAWFREGRAAPQQLAGFAVAAAAIWLVAYTPDKTRSRPEGLGLAVFAGLCFGVMLILMRLAAMHGVMRALIAMRLASASTAAVAGVVYFVVRGRGEKHAAGGFPTGKVLLLALVAGLLDTSGNLFYLFASLAGRLDVAAVLSSLYPAGTMLLAAILLRERATRSQAAGMVLALAAVALIAT